MTVFCNERNPTPTKPPRSSISRTFLAMRYQILTWPDEPSASLYDLHRVRSTSAPIDNVEPQNRLLRRERPGYGEHETRVDEVRDRDAR